MTQQVLAFWASFQVIFRRETWWAETWAALCAPIWAIWAWAVSNQMGTTGNYNMIFTFATEEFWVSSGLVLGILHIWAVVVNKVKIRGILCAVAAWWWGTLFIGLLLENAAQPGLVLYLAMFGINMVGIKQLRKGF